MSINEVSQVNQTNQSQYQKPGVLACTGGILAGGTVKGLTALPTRLINPKIMGKIKTIEDLTEDEFVKVANGIENSMVKSGLKDKGVEILRTTPENSAKIEEALTKEFNKSYAKFLPSKLKDFLKNNLQIDVKAGQNAFCLFKSNKIILPEKELALTAFHEMGHAANANFGMIGKVLQKCRPLTILALPIALIALFKTKKAPDEKPNGILDKTTDFIKNNAGKLTFLSFAPMLLEEGLASVKGLKFAKEVLNPELVAKVAKTNKFAYLTYLGLALASSAGIYLGAKTKDAIAKPKLINENPQKL